MRLTGSGRARPSSELSAIKWPVSARILRAFSRDPEAPDFAGGTINHVGKHALDFLDKTVPSFREMIVGKSVLDYGCGMGDQAMALSLLGAKSVTGYDPYPRFPTTGPSGVTFTASLPTEKFDIVLSSSSMEHFADPERELATMAALTSQDLVIAWAEPWYSHSGSHMNFFTRLPWVNLIFPETSVMLVRSLYRDDGAMRYEDCGHGGGVNRMTVSRFERIIAATGMRVEFYRNYATCGIPLVTSIPVIRELLTSSCTCILRPTKHTRSKG